MFQILVHILRPLLKLANFNGFCNMVGRQKKFVHNKNLLLFKNLNKK